MARRPDITRALDHLFQYGERQPWKSLRHKYVSDALSTTLKRFGMDLESLIEALHELGLGDMFTDFCLDATFSVQSGERRQNVVDEFLKWRGWQETRAARRYLQALRRSTPSLYEVTHVEPQCIAVRDLIGGGPEFRADVPVTARTLAGGDWIAALVVTLDEDVCVTDGLLRYPPEATQRLEALLSQTGDTTTVTSWPDLLQIWVEAVLERRANPAVLRNIDGERLAPSRARLPLVTQQPGVIAQRLDALPAWEREQFDQPRWVRCESLIADETSLPDLTASDIRRMLASARLDDKALTIDANSRERMSRVLAELNAALQGLVGPPILTNEEPSRK